MKNMKILRRKQKSAQTKNESGRVKRDVIRLMIVMNSMLQFMRLET